jgi:tetratricopeptide (TPR) repeat protein
MPILAALLLIAAPAPTAAQPCESKAPADAPACAAAIAVANNGGDRAKLLFQRAQASIDDGRHEEALRDLDEAIAYEFRNPTYLMERASTLNRLGEHRRAVADLDRRMALGGEEDADAYGERAFARLRMGDFPGAWEDRDRAAKLSPKDAGALIARAQAALWLGRFDDARRDVEAAAKLASRGKRDKKLTDEIVEARSDLANWTGGSGPRDPKACAKAVEAGDYVRKFLIADCTAAFFAARTAHEKAEALGNRAFVWLFGLHDAVDASYDRQVAGGIEPENADLLYYLGMSFYDRDSYQAARRMFDRSLAIEKTARALAARGAARLELGDKDGAQADARAAATMAANPMSNLVLARLAFDAGNRDAAKRYWMENWHRGWSDDYLRQQLKSVGVEDPDKEPKS